MAILKGRVFEKAGVHVSTVFGTFAPEFAEKIPGRGGRPALLGGRHFADRPSVEPERPDRAHEHALGRDDERLVWRRVGPDADARSPPHPGRPGYAGVSRGDARACAGHPVADYARYKQWCDDYFYLKHRDEPRGVGGIFFDYLNAGDAANIGLEPDFAFTRDVGESFLNVYPEHCSRAIIEKLDPPQSRRAAGTARPLCRVQPAVRSRHDLWAEDRRQYRFDHVFDAADGEMAVKSRHFGCLDCRRYVQKTIVSWTPHFPDELLRHVGGRPGRRAKKITAYANQVEAPSGA